MNMIDIRKKIKSLEEKLEQVSFKTRMAIFICGLLVIYLFWYVVMVMPLQKRIDLGVIQIKSTKVSLEKLERKVVSTSMAIMKPTDTKAFKELNDLKDQNDKISLKFDEFKKMLSGPDNIVLSLKTNLEKQEGMTLVSIQNQPPKKIFQSFSQSIEIHPIQMEFSGSYNGTVAFLQSMAQVKLPIYWDELYYRVEKYPYATIRVNVHALSYEKGA